MTKYLCFTNNFQNLMYKQKQITIRICKNQFEKVIKDSFPYISSMLRAFIEKFMYEKCFI